MLASLPAIFATITGVVAAVFIRQVAPTRKQSIDLSVVEIEEEARRQRTLNIYKENEDALERTLMRANAERQDLRDHITTLQVRVHQLETTLIEHNIPAPDAIFYAPSASSKI